MINVFLKKAMPCYYAATNTEIVVKMSLTLTDIKGLASTLKIYRLLQINRIPSFPWKPSWYQNETATINEIERNKNRVGKTCLR